MRFDATKMEPDESLTDIPVVNPGLFGFSASHAPVNSAVIVCFLLLLTTKRMMGECMNMIGSTIYLMVSIAHLLMTVSPFLVQSEMGIDML